MKELKRFLGYAKPYLGQMIAAAVMMAIAGALMSLVVATLNPLVNEVLLANPPKAEHATVPDEPAAFLDRVLNRLPIDQVKNWIRERPMAKVPVLLVTIFLLRGILLFFGDYLTRKTGSAIIRDLRADLHDSLIYQAPSFYRRHQTGEVLSRLLNDVHLIKLMSTQVFSDFFRVAAMAPAMLVLVLIYDWKLTLFALIVLPVMGYPVMRLGKRLRKAATRSQQQTAVAANQLKESVSGVKIIQAFTMEQISIDRFRETLTQLFRWTSRRAARPPLRDRSSSLSGPWPAAFSSTLRAGASHRAPSTPATSSSSSAGSTFLFMSARRLNQINVEVQQAMSAANRVFAMMDWPREVTERPEARRLETAPQEIHFDDVFYTYPGSDEPALKGIELDNPPWRDGCPGRPIGRRQDHDGQPHVAFCRPHRRPGRRWTVTTSAISPWIRCAATSASSPRKPSSSTTRSASISPRGEATPISLWCAVLPSPPRRTTS